MMTKRTPRPIKVHAKAGGCMVASFVSLLDHLIRSLQERGRDRQPEGIGGLEVNDQLELRRLLNGKINGLRPLQDLVDIQCPLPVHVIETRAVGHEGARMSVLRDPADGGKLALESKFGDLCSLWE